MVSRVFKESRYGTVRIELPSSQREVIPGLGKAYDIAAARYIYRWTPSEDLRSELLPSFELEFDCLTGKDHARRFYPTLDSESLIRILFTGGLAILISHHGLNEKQRWSYRMMFLLFQKMRKLNNRQQRNFRGIKDLYVKKSGRYEGGKKNILPDTLGDSHDSKSHPWGIEKLKTKGEELARACGYGKPSMRQSIEYGLFAAARMNPLCIEKPQQIAGLLRIALYNEQNTFDCDPQTRDWIEGEMLHAISAHLYDTQEQFNEWLWGGKNSFLKQIARKKCPHGKVTNPMVRKVLMDLGWKAYYDVGNCIHTQMSCFQNALPSPLNESERKIFEMVYQNQSYLGNLPLLLLNERIPFLKAPMLAWLNGQDDFDFVGTVHQLLYYYYEMADMRRGVDRTTQAFSVACRSQNRTIKIFEFDETCPVEDSGQRRKAKPLEDEENQG